MEHPIEPLFWTDKYWSVTNTKTSTSLGFTSATGERIYFAQTDGRMRIPGSATFGGWWSTNEKPLDTRNYLALYENFFDENRATSRDICLPPSYFLPEHFAPQLLALSQMGGRVTAEVNSAILLQEIDPLAPDYFFSRGNRKRVRSFARSGGEVRLASPAEFDDAHSLLKKNRQRRGARLSLNRKKFIELAANHPSTYRVWVAEVEGILMGAALTVEISQHATYVLYWGDTLAGRGASVVASICKELIRTAAQEGKAVLDLGVSSNAGAVDEGLLRFKENLGARRFDQPVVLF